LARPVCHRCHRPAALCVCRHFQGIPPVDNRTRITILQHPRERLHPLNTARIALQGLARVHLEVARGNDGMRGLTHPMALAPGTALLYPHDSAASLEQLDPAERPSGLLLLDGTWANVRTLYRANPWLAALPHVRLTPREPSRYRIRGEPDVNGRATVEAIVAALEILEPETPGLDRLLRVFDAVIARQVEQIQTRSEGPRRRQRQRVPRPVPAELTDGRPLVVVYVETVPGAHGRQVVHWTAVRSDTGNIFERLVRPVDPVSPGHLEPMQLSLAAVAGGVDLEGARSDWNTFVDPGAVIVAWNRSTLDRVGQGGIALKGIYCDLRRMGCGSLAEVVQQEGLDPVSTPFRGRAGLRTGQTLAMLRYLQRRA